MQTMTQTKCPACGRPQCKNRPSSEVKLQAIRSAAQDWSTAKDIQTRSGLGLNIQSVKRHLAELVRRGELETQQPGAPKPNLFKIKA